MFAIKIFALSALTFVTFKFLFWANATISLNLMGRILPQSYWRWMTLEIILSTVASIAFAAEMVLQTGAIFLPVIFMASSLVWLAYMSRRVWLISRPR